MQRRHILHVEDGLLAGERLTDDAAEERGRRAVRSPGTNGDRHQPRAAAVEALAAPADQSDLQREVAQAFDELYYLEKAAALQILALSTGRPLAVIPDAVAAVVADLELSGAQHEVRAFWESDEGSGHGLSAVVVDPWDTVSVCPGLPEPLWTTSPL